jgi:pimeloyl-ACP methyl ester carboxylesterase
MDPAQGLRLTRRPAEHVILLHGVWMRALTLVPLARRLRAAGYAVHRFDYSSLWRGPAPSADRLAARMLALGPEPVHLVGHSLGGLVALETVTHWHGLPPGRVLCLGSPLAGSGTARGLTRRGLGAVLGRSGALLRSGLHRLPPDREVGMIAGTRPVGVGRVFGDFDGPSDGTVQVWETRLPGLADHRLVESTHTGLVFNREVAALAIGFLATGRFPPAV